MARAALNGTVIDVFPTTSYEPYEPDEPTFDDEEPIDPEDPDHIENADGTTRQNGNHDGQNGGDYDPSSQRPNGVDGANGERTVVTGDPSAAGTRKNAVVGLREKKIADDKRSTTPYLTKYERARVLGTRALQIRYGSESRSLDYNTDVVGILYGELIGGSSMNAPVLVDLEGETDPLQIAIKELREKKIPLVVRRYLPDGWCVSKPQDSHLHADDHSLKGTKIGPVKSYCDSRLRSFVLILRLFILQSHLFFQIGSTTGATCMQMAPVFMLCQFPNIGQ